MFFTLEGGGLPLVPLGLKTPRIVPVITAGVADLRLQGFVTLIRLLFDYNLCVSIWLNYRADDEVLDGNRQASWRGRGPRLQVVYLAKQMRSE